jgi:hypothetical protein
VGGSWRVVRFVLMLMGCRELCKKIGGCTCWSVKKLFGKVWYSSKVTWKKLKKYLKFCGRRVKIIKKELKIKEVLEILGWDRSWRNGSEDGLIGRRSVGDRMGSPEIFGGI